jgi:hypothetical protein
MPATSLAIIFRFNRAYMGTRVEPLNPPQIFAEGRTQLPNRGRAMAPLHPSSWPSILKIDLASPDPLQYHLSL